MKGVVISGTGSGVGKTSVTTGLMSRLSKKMKVQAFKAGPDFIDPMYHGAATGRPGRNLDSFLMDDDTIRNLVGYSAKDADICVIEGVRGLFEGFKGDDDTGSTAHVAKLLGFPVILVIDARSLTRSAVAILNGFRAFDPDVNIAGVILNNVSGSQHAGKLKVAMERYCPDVEVLGMIRKSPEKTLEQRYLGLKTLRSYASKDIVPLQELTEPVDLDRLVGIAEDSPSVLPDSSPYTERDSGITVGIPMDDSYCFYYRENIECMEASGMKVRTFAPTDGDPLPDADMYYLGGGYPELYASSLSANRDFLEGIRNASDEGKPVIGECGGLMTMCKTITDKAGNVHDMAGIFDARSEMTGKRHGPTYVMASANPNNPVFRGDVRGHEYHYSDVFPESEAVFGFDIKRGLGICDMCDGLVKGNSIGSYMHQHALSEKDWIGGAVDLVYRQR